MRSGRTGRCAAFPLALVVLAALAGCARTDAGVAPGQPSGYYDDDGDDPTATVVTVTNGAFTPPALTVPLHTTITWRWESCSNDPYAGATCGAHGVTFDSGALIGSGVLDHGSYARTFDVRGTFTYHCAVHGAAMTGTITVQ